MLSITLSHVPTTLVLNLVLFAFFRPPPPCPLEAKINKAISSGDFKTAEALSDKLADRQVNIDAHWLSA